VSDLEFRASPPDWVGSRTRVHSPGVDRVRYSNRSPRSQATAHPRSASARDRVRVPGAVLVDLLSIVHC